MPTVTWNPADKDTLLTLSGGDLTVTMSADAPSGSARVRATLPATSGNFFEVVVQGSGGTGNGFGVVYAAQALTGTFDGATGVLWANNGWANGPGGWDGGNLSYGIGDKLGFYVTSTKVFFYLNDAYAGEYTHSLTVASLYPFTDYGFAGRASTANFGASSMTVPAGATSWDGSRTGTTSANITVGQLLSAIQQTAAADVVETTPADIANITVAQLLGPLQQDIQIGSRNAAVNQILGALIQVTAPRVLSTSQLLTAGQQAGIDVPVSQVARLGAIPLPPVDPTAVNPALIGTVNGTSITGSGTSGSPLVWPSSLLQSDNVMFARRSMSRTGGQTISGIEQVVSSATDFWAAEIRVKIRRAEQADAFRALMARANGRASNWLVPTCSNVPRTITVPGTPGTGGLPVAGAFSSGFSSGFEVGSISGGTSGTPAQTFTLSATFATVTSPAALGARSLSIRMGQHYQVPRIGQYFSIGSRLYVIGTVTAVSVGAGDYTITFSPGLRTAAILGTSLDFVNPKCRMRLAQDNIGDMSLDMLRFADVQMSFVEIPA